MLIGIIIGKNAEMIFICTIKCTNLPPVPLPTYLWEEIRRAKKRGGYPWTYLYKKPFETMDQSKKEPCFVIPVEHVHDLNSESNLRKQKSTSSSESCLSDPKLARKQYENSCDNILSKSDSKSPKNGLIGKFTNRLMKHRGSNSGEQKTLRSHSSPDFIVVPLRDYSDGYMGESQENFDSLQMLSFDNANGLFGRAKKVQFEGEEIKKSQNVACVRCACQFYSLSPPSLSSSSFIKNDGNSSGGDNNKSDVEFATGTTVDTGLMLVLQHRWHESDYEPIQDPQINEFQTLTLHRENHRTDSQMTIDHSTNNEPENYLQNQSNTSSFNMFKKPPIRSSFRKLKSKACQLQTKIIQKCPKKLPSCPSFEKLNSYPKAFIQKLRRTKTERESIKPPCPAIRRKKIQALSLNDLNNNNRKEHKKGVIEEINGDEFFLRQKGISQDNINERSYLSLEIRDAFRKPINSLGMDVCMRNDENRKQEQPLANDFSYAYPLMRDDFGDVPLKTSTISIGNNSNRENFIKKSPKAPPKRKSKSLKQLHFRDSKNHENMLNGQCNSQVPIAPKRTKSRTSILLESKFDMNRERDGREWNRNQSKTTMPSLLATSNYAIVQRPTFQVRKMHHTAKFLRNVPRSTLSLAIPERPVRSLSSSGSRLRFQLQNSRRSASYAEIPDALQLRPLPAPPRPPRKSKDSFAFIDDNQNQSQTLSSGIWMNGNSNSLSTSSGSNKDLKSDKEIRHGSLATPETNSIKDFVNSMTNQLLEQKNENTMITSRPIPVAVEKLHVIHLEVDQLRIGELRADKLSVNESNTNDLQANNLQTQTGQLRLNQLDFSQEVIQEIVRLLAYSIGQVRTDTATASEAAMGSSERSSDGNGHHIEQNGRHSQSSPSHDPAHSSDTDATAILSSSSLSDPVSPNRSEPLLPPPSPPNTRSLQSFRCPTQSPNRNESQSTARSLPQPPTTKTLNDNNDPLSTIANLTVDLIREIVTIAYSLIYHLYGTISDAFARRSAAEQNALLLIVAVTAGVIAVVLSTWVSSNRTPTVLHHHWQYYSPPSGDI